MERDWASWCFLWSPPWACKVSQLGNPRQQDSPGVKRQSGAWGNSGWCGSPNTGRKILSCLAAGRWRLCKLCRATASHLCCSSGQSDRTPGSADTAWDWLKCYHGSGKKRDPGTVTSNWCGSGPWHPSADVTTVTKYAGLQTNFIKPLVTLVACWGLTVDLCGASS